MQADSYYKTGYNKPISCNIMEIMIYKLDYHNLESRFKLSYQIITKKFTVNKSQISLASQKWIHTLICDVFLILVFRTRLASQKYFFELFSAILLSQMHQNDSFRLPGSGGIQPASTPPSTQGKKNKTEHTNKERKRERGRGKQKESETEEGV